ncbi:conserved hypothetical protein [Perkinsus marinus ATCC 50983]|uniref:protein-histidine N-methyltransferase n=1 Tax=Perkinsus marinus (strain ATCC 50983 / TXsc) TaxID=423536 RepID=C5L6N3_PERM5|nr:conserved hypothetical protein [Perkinsus marinus ATCC 50983]EER07694.1 conserved hypothetical protein [Perkinsus marinus ATCC 50983]|eukprot:XP_002775878.1 conserved hypothetical protein [Perkinsus marinus ATCC 50983]
MSCSLLHFLNGSISTKGKMADCEFITPKGSSERCSFRSVAVAEGLNVDVVSSIKGDFDSDVDLKSGFRVWECSLDLARYIYEHPFPVTRVLELGCGHALPTLAALSRSPGASAYVHDLDPLVLQHITAPNMSRSLGGAGVAQPVRYVTGPWGEDLAQLLSTEAGSFDLILSSEGIYKQSSFESLLTMVISLLDPINGVALFAGKRLYFGCGGGTAPFMSFIEEHYSEALTCRSVALFEDARSNIREIVEVRKKSRK